MNKIQEIPLESELDFLKRYLELQQVRYDDRLQISVQTSRDVAGAMVPAFVLQPLVENAIKHGIAKRSRMGTLEVSAWRENGSLRLRVSDDGPGLPPSWDVERSIGVGLGNTRQRLRSLYGVAKQSFRISNREDREGVDVDLTLPLHVGDSLNNPTNRKG